MRIELSTGNKIDRSEFSWTLAFGVTASVVIEGDVARIDGRTLQHLEILKDHIDLFCKNLALKEEEMSIRADEETYEQRAALERQMRQAEEKAWLDSGEAPNQKTCGVDPE